MARKNQRKKNNIVKYETYNLILRGLVSAAIGTKKKKHDNKLPRNNTTNILRKYAPKHPWLNKKLVFNHISTA